MRPVTRELLWQLAASQPEVSKISTQSRQEPSRGRPKFNIDAWLSDHQERLGARAPVQYDGGRKWIVDPCPFNAEHRGTSAAIIERANGKLGFKCQHASCVDRDWKALREFIDGPRPPRREWRRLYSAPAVPADAPDLLPYWQNDSGNANRLLAWHGKDLLYCHDFREWLIWDGRRWIRDDKRLARRRAKVTMATFLAQATAAGAKDAENFARESLNASRITALLTMTEPEVPILARELDQEPWLLNFRNGTLDLRNGLLRPHRREDRITKLVHHDYVPDAPCERWLRFLDRVMAGGPDADDTQAERANRFVKYLQRALGYSLTGVTIEKAVFIPFGAGNNGKTTMLSVFRELIEEYSTTLQVDTLMVRHHETANMQADLSDLRGARFVQTSETEEGQRIAQGKLKRITQGMGTIKSVRKYENPIEFKETHKLWMDTNRKPTISDADDKATFNRLHAIAFEIEIPDEEVDRDLPRKLRQEAEGILAWAVQGALDWYRSGLNPPPEVAEAVQCWRAESDPLKPFLDDCCVLQPNETADYCVQASDLHVAYVRWCVRQGERHTLSMNAFGRKMGQRFQRRHLENGAVYIGLGLKFVQSDLDLPEHEHSKPRKAN